MGVIKFLLAAGLLSYVGLSLFLFLMQSKLVFIPHRSLEATPADVELPYEDLRLASGPLGSETIHAWHVPVENARGTVLFCHGNAGNMSHRLETLAILHELGMNTLLFDYQGYGESTGKPSEQGTYQDAAACWDWLMERGVNPASIVVMGRSLGGGVASQAAQTHMGIAGLVLESTFTSVPDMGARMYPFLPVRSLSRIQYNTSARLSEINCPVLVAHSPDDDIVPYELGRELLKVAGSRGRFLELTGDHNSGFLFSADAYVYGLDQFFSSLLEK